MKNDYVKDALNEILELCRAIVPKSWNVYGYFDVTKHKNERGILNIAIKIEDVDAELEYVGKSEPIYYKGGVGHTEIILNGLLVFNFPIILLHELAHIVISRRESVRNKIYLRTGVSTGLMIEKDSHGKEFWKALLRLHKKAVRKGLIDDIMRRNQDVSS